METYVSYWTIILAAFYLAEKVVHLSKSPWDDILVDGLKYLATKIYNAFGRP